MIPTDWAMRPNTQWLQLPNGELYLIPAANVVAEIEGPDNPDILDALNADCRLYGKVSIRTINRLQFEVIIPTLRRFNPLIGYYVA